MKAVDKMTSTEYIEAFENLNEEGLQKLKESACPVLTVTQAANEILYVPAGWILSATTVQGPLAYGCRKCWVFQSESQHRSYEALHGLCAHSGMNTSKMEAALNAMAPDPTS